MITDCPCGGRYRDEHDHEGRWSRCDRCQTALPAWREFTDDEIRLLVRIRPRIGPSCATGWHWRCGDFDCACPHHVERLADLTGGKS